MKQRNYIKLGLISGLLVSTTAVYAANTTGSGATSVAPSQPFSVDGVKTLTVDVLDQCWNNREDLQNQKNIANLLMSKPAIDNNYEAAWKTARLVYFIGNYGNGEADFVTTGKGVKLFDYGVKAGEKAQSLNPNGVEGYYWYAVDLGSYGIAKGILSAASNADKGMNALKKAQSIDPSYQNYGSYRILGKYYQELPNAFGGDTDKALASFNTAIAKTPKFKNNWVFLGQYYISIGKYNDALTSCNKALSLPLADGKYEDMRYTKEAQACVSKAKDKLS